MSPTACLSYRSSLRSFQLWEERQKNGTLEINVAMQLYVVEDQHLQRNQPLFWQHVSSPVTYFVRVKLCIQSLSMWHRLYLTGSVDSHHSIIKNAIEFHSSLLPIASFYWFAENMKCVFFVHISYETILLIHYGGHIHGISECRAILTFFIASYIFSILFNYIFRAFFVDSNWGFFLSYQ